jgi:Lon protease-like protein
VHLPLFPLNVVLFPGMGLPLHIFEERYKAMIEECLLGDRRFGVCLIRAGAEVGEPAEPFLVGTETEIVSTRRLPDGRFHLVTVGRRRFRVLEITQRRPYVAGEVDFLPPDEAAGEVTPLAGAVREELLGYVQRLLELMDRPAAPFTLPREPEPLSYTASALLQLPLPMKQQLLEEPATEARLRQVLDHLRQARGAQEAMLRRHWADREDDPEANGGPERWN